MVHWFDKMKVNPANEKVMIEEDATILNEFLATEGTVFLTTIEEELEKVLNGDAEYGEFQGNIYGIEIWKDQTLVCCIMDYVDKEEGLEIDTRDFLKIIKGYS